MMPKAWRIWKVPYCFWGHLYKISRSHGLKNQWFEIEVTLLGQSQLSNPSHLPCPAILKQDSDKKIKFTYQIKKNISNAEKLFLFHACSFMAPLVEINGWFHQRGYGKESHASALILAFESPSTQAAWWLEYCQWFHYLLWWCILLLRIFIQPKFISIFIAQQSMASDHNFFPFLHSSIFWCLSVANSCHGGLRIQLVRYEWSGRQTGFMIFAATIYFSYSMDKMYFAMYNPMTHWVPIMVIA